MNRKMRRADQFRIAVRKYPPFEQAIRAQWEAFEEMAHTGLVLDLVALDLHPLGKSNWHKFPNTGGITGVSLLSESHLTCHTFPEYGSLCLNLFCCRPRPATDFEALLKQVLGATNVSVRMFERPYQV